MMFLTENFVVWNKKLQKNQDLIPLLFGKQINKKNEPRILETDRIMFVDEKYDMYDILLLAGLFKTRSHAKRDWKRTGKEVPDGFSDFTRIGKKLGKLTIWKPI